MLNAFNARSIFELGAKDRCRIDSLLAYGDKLILGLSTGALRVYRVDSPDTSDVSLALLHTIEGYSRRKIEILACIKEAGILVSLADGNVRIHDLNDFSLTETLSKARGASTLAVTSNVERDEETQIPSIVSRLAIGVRRKLLCYSWADGGFQEGKEVTLNGILRSLTWASNTKIVVGLTGSFVVVDVNTATVEEIDPSETANGASKSAEEKLGWASYVGMGGWGSKSLSTQLGGEELLLVKDSSSLFIDNSGKPIPNRQPAPWSTPPDAIAFSYPYLISLNIAKHQLEVRNPSTWTLLQSITLPVVTTLHVPPPNVSLVHAGKLFYVASPTQVWRMGSTDYETQINNLIKAEQLDEAIRLLETLESVLLKDSKEEKLREVQMLKAEKQFRGRKYEESMALFGQVSAPPERVVKLFPRVIAGDLSIWCEEEDRRESLDDSNSQGDSENDDDGDTGRDSNHISTTESQSENSEEASESKETVKNKDSGDTSPDKEKVDSLNVDLKRQSNGNLPEIYGPLKNIAFSRKYGETASIFSFGSRRLDDHATSDSTSLLTKKEGEDIDDTPKLLEGEELKKAVQELARTYLNDVRRKLTKYFDSMGNPIDPLVILAPGSLHDASRKDPLEASFLQSTPDVDDPAEERIERLLETCKLVDTTLFRAYMLIRPALVGPLVRIQNNCDPDVVSEKLREQGKFNDLIDFLERKKLHREALELLRFFGQADGDTKAPNLRGCQRTVTYLERLKAEHIELIFEFAIWPLKVEPNSSMEIFIGDTGNSDSLPRPRVLDYLENLDQNLAIRYLEHVLFGLKDMTPEFHTRLAGLYLSALSRDLHGEQKNVWHAKLLKFLETSYQYRAEKVLGWLPRSSPEYYEARAVVLSKMGRHKAALEIYVFKLKDYSKAEAYCTAVYHSSPSLISVDSSAADPESLTQSIYHVLLSLYLTPPHPYNQQLGPALEILSRHGARLDASTALDLIPENIRMKDLENYFEGRIRAANAGVAGNRIVSSLRNVHLIDIQEKLLDARSNCVVVAEETACPVCHKRLGLSVIWRLPSGQVVHYGCAKKLGE